MILQSAFFENQTHPIADRQRASTARNGSHREETCGARRQLQAGAPQSCLTLLSTREEEQCDLCGLDASCAVHNQNTNHTTYKYRYVFSINTSLLAGKLLLVAHYTSSTLKDTHAYTTSRVHCKYSKRKNRPWKGSRRFSPVLATMGCTFFCSG